MKFFAVFLCFYFSALTVLPSVRAVKMYFSENCTINTEKGTPTGCEKGKIIMNLNFNPVQFVASAINLKSEKADYFEIRNSEVTRFVKVFIAQYKSAIWQPPKIFSLFNIRI